MVRVAGLRGQVVAGIETPSEDGMTPAEQLDQINQDSLQVRAQLRRCSKAPNLCLGATCIRNLGSHVPLNTS